MGVKTDNGRSRSKERGTRLAEWLLALATSPWRLFKALCFVVGLGTLAVSAVIALYVATFLQSLPPLERMTFNDLETIAKQRIVERRSDKRAALKWTPLSRVSRHFLYSVVISEDATFFDHDGFNFDAIADSLAENIRERKPAFGGSTISQQVVKNLFLGNEKTFSRKVKEFLLTGRLESRFTKNEILEIYLNMAEFGPEIYGVDAAARHFFGVVPSEVNAAEGAFISLMLPSPRRYYFSVYQNRNLTRQKRKRLERVFRDMLYEEFITEADYRKYVNYDYFTDAGARLPARSRPGRR